MTDDNFVNPLIEAAELAMTLKKTEGHPILLDVREPFEHEEDHLPGDVLIPLDELSTRVKSELRDFETPIVVYCAHGVRSLGAAMALKQMGYTSVRSLSGGLCEYREQGF